MTDDQIQVEKMNAGFQQDGWTRRTAFTLDNCGSSIAVHAYCRGVGEPRVVVACQIHGDEFSGYLLGVELLKRWRTTDLHGSIEVVLAANPLAVIGRTRTSVTDGGDVNRGNSTELGGDTARVRELLLEYVARAQLVVNVHNFDSTGGVVGVHYEGLPTALRKQRLHDLRSIGVDAVWSIPRGSVYGSTFEETLDYALAQRGTASIALELPCPQSVSIDVLSQVVDGLEAVDAIQRVLRSGGRAERNWRKPRIVDRLDIVAPSSGVFVPCMECMASVQKGAVVGRLHRFVAPEEPVEIHAPDDGLLFYLRPVSQRNAGDVLCSVGRDVAGTP